MPGRASKRDASAGLSLSSEREHAEHVDSDTREMTQEAAKTPDEQARGSGTDETEKFLEQAVVPTDEIRERLLSFMVHEIRNPLASALWAVDMLERRSEGDARAERVAKLSARSVRRLRSLLEDFFTLERLPKTPKPGRVAVMEAIERALGPHDLEPGGIDAPVTGSQPGEIPLDPELVDKLLHTVMRRLARAGDGGPISVRVGGHRNRAEVVVERPGVEQAVVDPPLLTAEGSQGAGTVFSMFLARAMAKRLGVELEVLTTQSGTAIRLLFPLQIEPA